jgi:hypothetical protein
MNAKYLRPKRFLTDLYKAICKEDSNEIASIYANLRIEFSTLLQSAMLPITDNDDQFEALKTCILSFIDDIKDSIIRFDGMNITI